MTQFVDSSQENKITNGWQLIIALVNGNVTPSKEWGNINFRLKFLCRSLLNWRITVDLANMLASNFLMEKILRRQPDLPCKLHRPYLTAKLNKLERLSALRDHYTLVMQRMPLKLLLGSLNEEPVILGSAVDKYSNNITLKMSSFSSLNREGEMTLLMCNARGVILAKITFILMNYCQRPTLFIGGLQGAAKDMPHTEIQETTKACYGLFPKRLALEGICSLAHYLGVDQIIAVGNAGHIYRSWRYHNKKEQLHADYDQFWSSIGGRETTSGYFKLPLRIPRKPIESIASKKRAEYRRRYQLLDSLEGEMSQWFQ